MTSEVTIRELVDKLYAASEKMSRKNPHRILMLHAVSALIQMSQEAADDVPRIELARPRVTLQ